MVCRGQLFDFGYVRTDGFLRTGILKDDADQTIVTTELAHVTLACPDRLFPL